MNLFITSKDHRQAARELDDKRVNKIALEATQLLATVLHLRGQPTPPKLDGEPYKPTHPNHPLVKWLMADRAHTAWTLRYGLALCEQHTRVTGNVHGCEHALRFMKRYFRSERAPTWFQNSARHKKLGLDFTHLQVCVAYRRYLCARWPGDKRTPVWTNRPRPRWARF